jgi:hydroxypyruvate isomerase
MKSSRRKMLKNAVASTLALGGLSWQNKICAANIPSSQSFSQSVSRECYPHLPFDDFAADIKKIGFQAVDLMAIQTFEALKKHDLHCSMVATSSQEWNPIKGWNKPEHHVGLIKWYKHLIDQTAKAGFKNIICFAGNRDHDLGDEQGLENCAEGLSQIIAYAEQKKATLMMALLNSKIDHKNYMADATDWGVELCRMLDSENFKLLYSIYDMQIMEGDIMNTITENKAFLGHYHTAGVPNKGEINENQELNYRAIMKTINATQFTGYIGHAFVPKAANKIEALKKAFDICHLD